MQFVRAMPFEEAVRKIGRESPIGSKLDSAQWRDVPVALRESAMFSSTVENARWLSEAQNFIGDFLKGTRDESGALKAGSRAQFVKDMSAFAIKQGMGPLDPEDAGTLKDITSQARLSVIFNTKVQQAQSYGYWKQGQDPDVLDAFPAQRFVREQDVEHARDKHAAFEGQVRLKSDLAFWLRINQDFGVPWGPWGWGCGHGVEDVSREEAEQLGLIAPGQAVKPVEKEFNERLQASTRGLAPEIKERLIKSFGEQVEYDDEADQLRWRKKKPPEATP